MKVFIIGITGGVGRLLAEKLHSRGDSVSGLVRRAEQRVEWADRDVMVGLADIVDASTQELAVLFGEADAVVYSAGSNGGAREITTRVDGEGVAKAAEAAKIAGIQRFYLVSVLPESWRERELGEEVEYYFSVKKQAEIQLTRTALDWVVLRPSLLLDGLGTGEVSLGPAEFHGEITRDDVAETLAEILHEPRINQQILELNTGSTPIRTAVQANVSELWRRLKN